ncbi:MAG: S41 family peptidase [Candidatus Limivicinus sp.]|nr:S41 family peptidase [Clostridiales bacterium]MDY5082973.1 S41 family peptidase [Candidatus Limivicinus sp.]
MSLGTRLMNAVVNVLTAILNIRIRFKYVLLAFIIFVGGAIGITYKHMLDLVGGKDDFDEAKRYIEIKDVVEEQYIDEVSRQTLGDYAAAAMVSGLADKWSYYMSADEYKTYQLNSANEYSGIGMSIMKQDDGSFQVVSVNADSPAGLAGLGAGDVITAVDGEDITSMSLDEARKLIRSKMNGKFTLGLGRKNSIEVDCSSVYQSAVNYRLEKTEAGYIQILNFEAGSGDDAIAAVEDLLNQGAVALCIDLRGNPGGLDTECAKFLDYLLPNGTLFIETDKQGNEKVTTSDGMCIQLPMCVLVNAETFGEAEVCAAVLQEYQWATVLGEATTGKTRTQETIPLEGGSALRLSTGTYLTGNRTDISAKGGVVPDLILYNSDASATGTTDGTVGESTGVGASSNDEQLMQALKLLS